MKMFHLKMHVLLFVTFNVGTNYGHVLVNYAFDILHPL